MLDPYQENEILLARFNKLIGELLRGSVTRNTFQPWEVDLLLDIDACDMSSGNRKDVLRRYQKAVQRSVDKGAPGLMKLSEYLEAQRSKRVTADPASLPAQQG
jgi:hypothetical protein